jgi:glycosyltransferase involved in cell wall biosynthesis
MVVLEATAAGIPVIATGVGGVPDLLGEGPNVAAPCDDAALAAAIYAVLGDQGVAREAVSRAREHVARSGDPSEWIRRHVALYTELSRRPTEAARSR